MADFERIHLLVSGKVQGVGFRYSTQKQAVKLALSGWVKNLPDFKVEVWAEGPIQQIEALYQWCLKGPTSARVEKVTLLIRESLLHASTTPFEIHE